jgi:hypothetical protein
MAIVFYRDDEGAVCAVRSAVARSQQRIASSYAAHPGIDVLTTPQSPRRRVLSLAAGLAAAPLVANLGRNLIEGRLGVRTAAFEVASTKTRIHMENR